MRKRKEIEKKNSVCVTISNRSIEQVVNPNYSTFAIANLATIYVYILHSTNLCKPLYHDST